MDPSLIVLVITVFSSFSLSYGTRVIMEEVTTCDGRQGKFVNIAGLKIVPSNDGRWGLSGTLTLLKDLPPNTEITGTVYKSLFTWIPLMPVPKTSVCGFVKGNNFISKIMKERSNFPKTCPLHKGKYEFTNGMVTGKYLPWYVPRGCFKIDLKLQTKSSTIECYKIIGNVANGKIPSKKICL